MKLPNADKALIQREKIADYLLNAAHPDNNGKAEFFESFGFRLDDWETLAKAFRRAAFSLRRRSDSTLGNIAWSEVCSPRCDGNAVRQIAAVADGLDC